MDKTAEISSIIVDDSCDVAVSKRQAVYKSGKIIGDCLMATADKELLVKDTKAILFSIFIQEHNAMNMKITFTRKPLTSEQKFYIALSYQRSDGQYIYGCELLTWRQMMNRIDQDFEQIEMDVIYEEVR